MKKLIIALVLFSSTNLFANKHHPFGLGIFLGYPSGFTGKYWLREDRSINGGLAFGTLGIGWVFIHGAYVFHFPGAFGNSTKFVNQLTPYVGIGGGLMAGTLLTSIVVYVPLGIEWRLPDPRIGIFLEIGPGVGILPSTFGIALGGIGARYFF